MTDEHASGELLRRYARGDDGIPADQVWAVEAHLELCGTCRGRLTEHADVAGLLDAAWSGVEAGLTAEPGRSRRVSTWYSPAMLPWLGATVLVAVMAMCLDLLTSRTFVLLLAPVAPVLGVATAMTTDPAREVLTATPRGGLELVLRRTLAVLVVVIPALTLAGLPVGTSPGLWLVPCLAFTVGTLALGGLIGTTRAAAGLAGAWGIGVAGPSFAGNDLPVLLSPAYLPLWAAVTAVCCVVLVVRADGYTHLN